MSSEWELFHILSNCWCYECFYFSYSRSMQLYLIEVLICIFLIINEVGNFKIYLLLFGSLLFFIIIYFWLRWVFVAARRLSLVAASGGYSSLQCAGFSLRWLLLLQHTGPRACGLSSCGAWALGCTVFSSCDAQAQQLWLAVSRVQAQQLWHTGFVALRHVGSSWTRD